MSKLESWFINQQIQSKLRVIHLVILALALLPVFIALVGFEYYALRQQAIQEIQVQANIISDNVLVSLAFDDDLTASESLATLESSPDVIEALLFKPDGSLLASFTRNDSVPTSINFPHIDENQTTQEKHSWNSYSLIKPLYLHSQFVGNLKLIASLDTFYQRVTLYVFVITLSISIGILISLFFANRLKGSIVTPLSQLMGSVNQVSEANDYTISPLIERSDEIGDLSRAFHEMMTGLRDRDARLKDLAFYDNVTGLPNRHFFQERIEQVVHNAMRYGHRCCLMFIDLDDFKTVNDTKGHHIGDGLLQIIGQRLSELLRSNDLICRIGGDEFAVILEKVDNMNTAEQLAQKIIEVISQPADIQGFNVKVGASIGISACPDHAVETYSLLQAADTAMYVAKRNRKNTYHLYQTEDRPE